MNSDMRTIRTAATKVFAKQVGLAAPRNIAYGPDAEQSGSDGIGTLATQVERNAEKWSVLAFKKWLDDPKDAPRGGSYSFRDSALGRVLFNRHGEVAREYWDKFSEVSSRMLVFVPSDQRLMRPLSPKNSCNHEKKKN